MGVVNVTPDSFYDGGCYFEQGAAIEHGRLLLSQGADILDVGGESSRPGASPVALEEELRRVLPVVAALAKEARVSIDTMKPAVAEAAVDAGASLINDVSSSLAETAARSGAGLIVMHMQGTPKDMQHDPRYGEVLSEVASFLFRQAESAGEAGVEEIYIDPGIGFGKTAEHNLALLAALPELVQSGWPVLVGTSRKGLIGKISALGQEPLAAHDRLEGSLASAVFAMAAGVAIVRVHDVFETVQASRIVGEVKRPAPPRLVVPDLRAALGSAP